MIQTGHKHASDHSGSCHTDRESPSPRHILRLVQPVGFQRLLILFQQHKQPQTAHLHGPHCIMFSCYPLLVVIVRPFKSVLEYRVTIIQPDADGYRKMVSCRFRHHQAAQLPSVFIGEMRKLQDLLLHCQYSDRFFQHHVHYLLLMLWIRPGNLQYTPVPQPPYLRMVYIQV